MSTPTSPLDIVAVATVLAAALFGSPSAAEIVGPYAVIVLAAIVGAAWSSSRRPPTTRLGALLYVVLVVALAVLVTVPLAELAARYAGVEARSMFAPVALVIGGIGPDWPGVVRWALGLLRGVLERRAGQPPGAPGDPP